MSRPFPLNPTRREILRLGGLGVWGLAAGSAVAAVPATSRAGDRSAAALTKRPGFGRAKSVVFVFCAGGQSQIDTWDPKPDAPETVRGAFRTVSTSVPGTFFTEHMPRIAKLADRLTVVRSMSHDDLDHGSANYLTLTGKYHRKISGNPVPMPIDEPTLGAVLRAVRPTDRFPYDAVHLNAPLMSPREPSAGQQAGLLGGRFEPMVLGNVTKQTTPLPDLAPLPELTTARMHDRRSLKEALDTYSRRLDDVVQVRDVDIQYAQALALLDRPTSREAFDLSREPEAVRERYGRNQSGQALLLARRLVEAGLPLVTVFWSPSNRGQDDDPTSTDAYGWDTHNDIFEALRRHLLPRFDLGFSAFIEDLEQRGLLESTLVVCAGEFGRAPIVALEKKFAGSTPGRKHWANAYSIAVAGAGTCRGKIVGATDRLGGRPDSERFGPWDTAATIFSALGIDPAGHYVDPAGRPIPLSHGRPIADLYA